jgi:hypothetical protein
MEKILKKLETGVLHSMMIAHAFHQLKDLSESESDKCKVVIDQLQVEIDLREKQAAQFN